MVRRVRRILPAVALVVCACQRDLVAPLPTARPADGAYVYSMHDGPPASRSFGSDTYRVGLFTGQGTEREGLHCEKTAPDLRTCSGYLASAVDGALLEVGVEIPLRIDKPVPLVALIHGYAGSKGASADIARALLADGYAVLRYSTRGFGLSWGQVNLVDVHAEVADLRSMIAQVVDDQNLHIDGGTVAVAGASYGGGHSWLAALQPQFTTPRGAVVRIRAVVPIATWSDLLYSLLPNGRERDAFDGIGGAKLSFINGLYIGGIREKPERPYPNYPDYFVAWHAWINTQEPTSADPVFASIADGLGGYRSIWWQSAFWDAVRAGARIPVFLAQGFTDDLFPVIESERMMRALRSIDPAYPVAAYYGDIGHPRASNKTGEVDHALGLIRAWLAYYMNGAGTQPPNVVYAARTRPRDEPFDAGNVVVAPSLSSLATASVSHTFDGSALLVNPLTDPMGGFFWDPLVLEGARELRPLPVPPESPLVPGSLVTYDVPVTQLTGGSALEIAGMPTVSLDASTVASRVQLNVRLFDVDASGRKQLITRGTYTLVGGSIGGTNVVIPTYGNFWRAEAGHTLRLELTNVDSPYITPSRVPSETTVSGVRLDIPVR